MEEFERLKITTRQPFLHQRDDAEWRAEYYLRDNCRLTRALLEIAQRCPDYGTRLLARKALGMED